MMNATSHVRFNRLTGTRATSKTQFSSWTSPFSFWMFFCNNVTLALLPVLITLQLSTLAMTTTATTTKHTHTNTEKKKLALLGFGFCREALFFVFVDSFPLATIRYVLTTRTHAQAKAQKTSSQREKGGLDARGKEGAVCAPLCS